MINFTDIAPPKVTVNKRAVKAVIEKEYKNKKKTRESLAFKDLLLITVNYIIDSQIKDESKSMRLDLSDNLLVKHLNCSTRQAARIRETLKSLDIIFFPEWSRPKKKGDYPVWFIRYEYLTFASRDKKVKKPVVNRKYKPLYYIIKDEALKEVYKELSSFEASISMKFFMMLVYQRLDEKLDELGIDKSSLLR